MLQTNASVTDRYALLCFMQRNLFRARSFAHHFCAYFRNIFCYRGVFSPFWFASYFQFSCHYPCFQRHNSLRCAIDFFVQLLSLPILFNKFYSLLFVVVALPDVIFQDSPNKIETFIHMRLYYNIVCYKILYWNFYNLLWVILIGKYQKKRSSAFIFSNRTSWNPHFLLFHISCFLAWTNENEKFFCRVARQ